MNCFTTWMEDNKDYLQNKTVFDILLPGTHDSGIFLSFFIFLLRSL